MYIHVEFEVEKPLTEAKWATRAHFGKNVQLFSAQQVTVVRLIWDQVSLERHRKVVLEVLMEFFVFLFFF